MSCVSNIKLDKQHPILKEVDFNNAVIKKKKDYLRLLEKYQDLLEKIQVAYFHQKRKAIILFEGWDASGKGGTLRRITEKLDPRGYRVYPIAAPDFHENQRHYLYRFHKKVPPKGSLSIFDRSYYGRVLVERIEGLCSTVEWGRAYQEINEFERLQLDNETKIVKIFLHVTPDEQLNRFEERLRNPKKQWKLTLEDIRNRERWADYEVAINEMFQKTSTVNAKWNVIAANHKWYARIQSLKIITRCLMDGVDIEPPPLDEEMINVARARLGIINK